MGGKFIQRGRVKKPNSHEYYTQADFYTGARIEFNKFGFVLYQADEYSVSYMRVRPGVAPHVGHRATSPSSCAGAQGEG